jgi:hypothetical protein
MSCEKGEMEQTVPAFDTKKKVAFFSMEGTRVPAKR